MSTFDNLHKKVLTTNALKTNFISNTNLVNNNAKNKQEKRFSNISKQKQLNNQFRHTVNKNNKYQNNHRYCQEVNLQDSATILPQKNSSRKNIYINQNVNLTVHPNNNMTHNNTFIQNQRKQSQTMNINTIKAKSPIDKNRINPNNIPTSHINMIPQNVPISSNNTQTIPNNIPNTSNQITNHPIQNKQIPQIKNLTNKISQALTQRQKSQKSYRQRDQNPTKDQPISKMKSMIMNNRKFSSQIQDLICDQQLQIALVPQKQHSRKLSNHYNNKTQIKNQLHSQKQINIKEKQENHIVHDHHSQQNNRTQKKYIPDKPTLILQKTKSEHTITTNKDHLTNMNSATLQPNTIGQKSIPHLTINNDFQPSNNRQTNKFHINQVSFINYEEQLKKFTVLQTQINMSAQIQTIFGLQNRQKKYIVQPNYIEIKQKHFNWFMRAILVDWMMHVCYQFGLKRQTFYIAVALSDKYLESTIDLPKSDFQLTGAACMFIAAKLQEFQALSSADFSKSTDNRYSPIQIRQMQLKICKTMNYELNPPTLYMWANRFMVHWDNYIDMTNAKFHPYFQNHKQKYFKKQAQQSYLLFRQMMQFIDCSVLDVQTLQFAHKILVCSFMYLVLGKSYKQWPLKRIVEQFPRSSHYLVEQEEMNSFNHLFHMFLADSFDLDIIELLPAVQYCSTYFTLPLNFDPPSYALKNGEQEQSQLSLQEYQSFQTYNGKMIDLIKKRYRGVYP